MKKSRVFWGCVCLPAAVLLFAGTIFLCGCSKPQKKTLKVSIHAPFPPFEFFDGEKLCGLDPMIAQEIANELGLQLELVENSVDYLLTSVATGKTDLAISAIIVRNELRAAADFSEPYAVSELVIAVPQDSPVRNARDLQNKLVGVLRGRYADEYAVRHIGEPIRFANLADAVSALQSGKVDALVTQRAPLTALLRHRKTLKILEPALEKRMCAIAVRKGNDQLLETVNRVLRRLKSTGKLTHFRQHAIQHANRQVPQKNQQQNTLRAAFFAYVPPYSFLRDNVPDGVEMVILKRIAQDLSMEVQMEPVGFDVLFEIIAEKNDINIGTGLIACTQEREKYVDFSIPYLSSWLCLYLPANSPITRKEQLKGKRIGAVYGTSSEAYVRRNIGIPECYTGQVLMFRALNEGKLDAIVTEQYAGDYFSRTYPQIRRLDVPLQPEKYAFAIRKGHPELRNSINRVLQKMLADGTVRQLIDQYYREYQP